METDNMGMKIKYWTKASDIVVDQDQPVVEAPKLTKAGKPRKVRATKTKKVDAPLKRKSSDRFVEIEADVASLGVTVEFWKDQKNEDHIESLVKTLPGIIYGWGYSQYQY
jgi:hypothetical protein